MNRVRGVMRVSVFLLLTLALMPVQMLFTLTSRRLARWFPHVYHMVLKRILGFNVIHEGNLPRSGPALLVANHASWIDIVALSSVLPVSFIAKREVGTWPLFGWMAKLQRTVFVDRDKRQGTKRAQDEISTRLMGGDVLVLFPEGTSHDGMRVLPFKSALFGVAELDGIPVIPVTIAYTRCQGLPMSRRQRPLYAWYGDMELPPHLWAALEIGVIGITITFHAPLAGGNRKDMARSAEATIRRHLPVALHGRGQMR